MFILSYEGLLSTLLQVKTLQQLGQLGSAPPDAFKKATTIIHIPGRGAIQMPALSANFAHTMIARNADERRTALGGWPDLAGRHSMATGGTCPFDPGPVEIVQQDHFIVGHRNGRLLFMGSFGTNGAFAIANEPRFGSMVVDASGKPTLSIPDAPSEFFKGSASSTKLSVTAQTGGDCRFEVTRAN